MDGWSVANNESVTVALETKLSKGLIAEGVSREFINRVQGLRKTKGFNVVNWVNLVEAKRMDDLKPFRKEHLGELI